MASIKAKKGKCIDCPNTAQDQYLCAGRCKNHYWQHRNKVNASKPGKDNYQRRQALDKWFVTQISMMPKHCEECGEYLNPYLPWGAKAYIAHILPKRHFESVMTHPLNRLFLCVQCHTNYDNWDFNKISKMKIFPISMHRSMQFLHLVHVDEYCFLSEYLMNLIN